MEVNALYIDAMRFVPSLKLTANISPKNQWLEDENRHLGGRECNCFLTLSQDQLKRLKFLCAGLCASSLFVFHGSSMWLSCCLSIYVNLCFVFLYTEIWVTSFINCNVYLCDSHCSSLVVALTLSIVCHLVLCCGSFPLWHLCIDPSICLGASTYICITPYAQKRVPWGAFQPPGESALV